MFVVVSLYMLLPPIRLDFIMRIVKSRSDMEDKSKNYLLNISRNCKYFYVNEFKTSGNHSPIEIKVPSALNTILNGWLRINDSEHLLLNKTKSPMSPNSLGKYITKAFLPSGKKISINMLRKIYISENVDLEVIKKRQDMANIMAHSVKVQQSYIKV